MLRLVLSVGAALVLSSSLFAQLPPEKALATMKAGDGLQVELFAAEPMVLNPTAIDVDHLGRVWVSEAVNYRRKNFGRPILRPEGDRIQVLIDETGTGKASKAVTFYQGPELYGPLSVLVLPQADRKSLRVLVAQSPDILEFWDKDGDLKADGPPTKWLTGFGGFDHDHGVHGLTVGPDGKLYFTVGDSGVTGLQSKDGKGKKWISNNTDVQKGTVWRCDLNGNNLELIAHNFRNNYEACVDSFGEIWLSDNDDDGNQQTRICHVYPGGNYGYGPRGPGQSHWHEEQPGIVHKTLRTGFGSPTGICFYEGKLLPKQYQGDLIHADAGPREIRYFKRKPKGAGYELEKINMLTSSDNWFRPSDVCVAPDGSVMVADWYDPGVGGHGMGDWTRGRIYRLTPTGHKGYKLPDTWNQANIASRTFLQLQQKATVVSDPRDIPLLVQGREKLIGMRTDPVTQNLASQFFNFAKLYDGQDIFYRAALNIACGTDPARRDAILADFEKHFPEWNDKVADLVWELRPKSMLPNMEKLLSDSKLTATQKARIVDILAVNDSVEAGQTMLKLVQSQSPPEVKAKALDNLRQFIPTKWQGLKKSPQMAKTVETLLTNPATQTTGLQLIAATGLDDYWTLAAGIAEKIDQPAELRRQAIATLGELRSGPKDILDALYRLSSDATMREPVINALGNLLNQRENPTMSQNALQTLQAFFNGVGPEENRDSWRRAVLPALASSRSGTAWLLQLQETKKFPETLVADAGKLLRNSPFQGERNKAMILFPAPGKMNTAKLPAIAELAKRKGNAETGKQLMAKSMTSEVQCMKCHMVRGQGGLIGPDLSLIGKKGSRENLFESILYPSKAIADQYVSWKVDTADGQSIVGLVVQETETTLTLRDANGKDYVIPTKDVEKKSKSLVSLMPEGLIATLTEDELVDLVEYMTTLETASLTPESWLIAGPFGAANMEEALNGKLPPEQGPFDLTAKFKTNGTETGWKLMRIGANGYFDLAGLHGEKANNSASFAYREIESPVEQEATILLGSDDGAVVWLNGKDVHRSSSTRAAAPEQNKITVKLKAGKNTVMLKVANGNNPHGFYFTMTSAQELKLVK